jgi:hypothetical protein
LVSASATAAEQDYQVRADATRKALRLARLRYEAGYSVYLEVLGFWRKASVEKHLDVTLIACDLLQFSRSA